MHKKTRGEAIREGKRRKKLEREGAHAVRFRALAGCAAILQELEHADRVAVVHALQDLTALGAP